MLSLFTSLALKTQLAVAEKSAVAKAATGMGQTEQLMVHGNAVAEDSQSECKRPEPRILVRV